MSTHMNKYFSRLASRIRKIFPVLGKKGSQPAKRRGKIPARGSKSDILAEIDIEVTHGETYEVLFRASCAKPLTQRFALVTPHFFDAENKPLKPVGNVAVLDRIGAYSYLVPSKGTEKDACLATATFIAPAGAVRMKAQVLPSQMTKEDLGAIKVATVCLGDMERFSAEGRIDLDETLPDVIFSGEVGIDSPLRKALGIVDILFLSADGRPILVNVDGLQSSERFLNYMPLNCQHDRDRLSFQVGFSLPPQARWLHWRLRPDPGQSIAVIGDFRVTRQETSITSALAALPMSARKLAIFDEGDCNAIHRSLPLDPLWRNIFSGKLALLGEVICLTAHDDWIEISGSIELQEPLPVSSRIVVCPIYFNSKKIALNSDSLPGCTALPATGPVRYVTPASSTDLRISLREAFLTPKNAVFAAFYIVALDESTTAIVNDLAANPVHPDAVYADINTSLMDQGQVEQAVQIAEQTRNLPIQRLLAIALASWNPKDVPARERAQNLSNILADLDDSWLPVLPPQQAYEPNPSTILHLFKVIYPDESSGGAVRGTSIVEAQARAGLQPVVCMPLNSPRPDVEPSRGDGIDEVNRSGVLIAYPYYPGMDRKKIAPADLLSIETVLWNRIARRHRAGLVHAASGFRGYENALKGVSLARANNLPLLYEVRSFHEHTWRPISARRMGDSVTKLRILQENRCMAAADAVATISQAMVEKLIERGVPEDRLILVPNAIDPIFETLAPQDEVAALRQRHGIYGKTTIGYISNFSQREGHGILLDAFTRLVAEGRDFYLVMVGDGPERANILKKVEKRKLSGRVILPGNVDHSQVRGWYHAIDLFVVPRIPDFASDYVTPLKPFEAMSQGIPLVISERPVTAEIAGAARDRASVFPAGDSDALAELIGSELDDPGKLQARAARAREWVMAERVWSNVVRRYEDAYEVARRFHADRNKREIAR